MLVATAHGGRTPTVGARSRAGFGRRRRQGRCGNSDGGEDKADRWRAGGGKARRPPSARMRKGLASRHCDDGWTRGKGRRWKEVEGGSPTPGKGEERKNADGGSYRSGGGDGWVGERRLNLA